MASTTTNNGQYTPSTPFSGAYTNGQTSGGATGGTPGSNTVFPGSTPGFFGAPIGFNPFFGQGIGQTPGLTNGFGVPAFGAPAFGYPTSGTPTTGVPSFNPTAFVNPYLAYAALTGQFNPFLGAQANPFATPFANPYFNAPTNPFTNPFVNFYGNQYGFQNTGFGATGNAWTPWTNTPWNAFYQGWSTTPWSGFSPSAFFNGFNGASTWQNTPTSNNPFFGAGFGTTPTGTTTPWFTSNPFTPAYQTGWTQGTSTPTGVVPFGGVPTFVSPTGWPGAWTNPFTGAFNATGTTGTFGTVPFAGSCPVTGDCACPPGVCFGQNPGFSGSNGFTPGFNPGVPTFGTGSNYGYTQPFGWNQFNWGTSPWNVGGQYPGAWTTGGVNTGTWNTFGTPWNGFFPTNAPTPNQSFGTSPWSRPLGTFGTIGQATYGPTNVPFGYGYPYPLSASPAFLASFAGGVNSAYAFPYATNPNNAFIPGTFNVQGTIPGVTGSQPVVATVSGSGAALAGCCRAAA